ncbi:MAG: thioredoxin [Clostridia bacterium]|nr:thioredoxin [Clostridia bacterium]MBQ6703973.1 thioredoxin [Clostridia bacterium]
MTVQHITSEVFQKEVIESSVPVLLDFYASWCGPCKALSPVLEEVAAEAEGFKVFKVNIDEQPELTKKYRIMSVPTLVVVNEGKTQKRTSGVLSKEEILSMIS